MSLKELLEDFSYSQLITRPGEVDLEIFKEFVKPSFKPREKPNTMVVGAAYPHEANTIRNFLKYGYDISDVNVAGCNILGIASQYQRGFDYFIADRDNGDAAQPFVWEKSLSEMNSKNPGYDLVYIRNPDLIDIREHAYMFGRSISNLSDNGLLVTLVRKDDQREYENLLDYIYEKGKIEPLYSGPTGIDFDGSSCLHNPYHTIGVFRK